jgi:hemolysin III
LKIAGTYTPFAIVKMGGLAGFGLLAAVWAVALIGAGAKLLLTASWDRLAIALYLVLGWAVLTVIQPLAQSLPFGALLLLGLGGGLYSVGVIFHVWNGLPYQKAIWHLFVLAGTACHFGAVTRAVFA